MSHQGSRYCPFLYRLEGKRFLNVLVMKRQKGAEQNAPLGRAVIGGLLFATVSTLFFVPLVFAGIHSRLARRRGHSDDDHDQQNGHGTGAGEPAHS